MGDGGVQLVRRGARRQQMAQNGVDSAGGVGKGGVGEDGTGLGWWGGIRIEQHTYLGGLYTLRRPSCGGA